MTRPCHQPKVTQPTIDIVSDSLPLPVLFVHGLGQTPQSWQDQVVALPIGTTMLAPWVRGMRPGTKDVFDVDAAVGDLVLALDARGIDRAQVCGNGLGAVLAARLAARHPHRVGRVVLAHGFVGLSPMAIRLRQLAIKALPASSFAEAAVVKERLLAALGALRSLDLRGDLARIDAPTLVLVGRRDARGLKSARQVGALIAGAQVIELDGGAQLNTEAPEEFNRHLVDFLTLATDQ